MPKRVPIHVPSTENRAVTLNMMTVGAMILMFRKEKDTPTAAASILVAMDIPIRVRVCQGQHFWFSSSSVGVFSLLKKPSHTIFPPKKNSSAKAIQWSH